MDSGYHCNCNKLHYVNFQKGSKYELVEEKIYEGGLNLWEGAKLFCEYINTNIYEFQNTHNILELGSGTGTISHRLMEINKDAKLFCQDLNKKSLMSSFLAYQDRVLSNNDNQQIFFRGKNNCHLIITSWENLARIINKLKLPKCFIELYGQIDTLIAVECIYRVMEYPNLEFIINKTLSSCGICYVVTKRFYFGIQGSPGTTSFLEYIKNSAHSRLVVKKRIELINSKGTIPCDLLYIVKSNEY